MGALLVGLTDTLGKFLLPVAFGAVMEPGAGERGGLGAGLDADLRADGGGSGAAPARLVRRGLMREGWVNAGLLTALIGVPLAAQAADEPFVITLATKVAILALAGVGLNLALGFGGLVSFGHAAFFGIGGYAAGILASHAANYEPLMTWPVALGGTKQMIADLAGGDGGGRIGGAGDRRAEPAHLGRVFHHGDARLRADALSISRSPGLLMAARTGCRFMFATTFPALNTFDPLQFFAICCALLIAGLVAHRDASTIALWAGAGGRAAEP